MQRGRVDAAAKLAHALRAHVVLKGAGSVLAHPDGRYDINASGNPALASAGSGDVLAGLLGAFLAQGVEPATALRVAVCLHGAAADRLVARGIGPDRRRRLGDRRRGARAPESRLARARPTRPVGRCADGAAPPRPLPCEQ